MQDETRIYIAEAIRAKAEMIEKDALAGADKLSQSDMQSTSTQDYFRDRLSILKGIVAEMRQAAARTAKGGDIG